MIRTLLTFIPCFLGLHWWQNIRIQLSHWDPGRDFYKHTDQCANCGKLRTRYRKH